MNMNKNNIYIITLNDTSDNNVKILATFYNNLKAIEFIQKQIEKTCKKGYHIVFINDRKICIYEKIVGWVSSSKVLKYIYQVHEYNKYPDDYNNIETTDYNKSE